MNYYTFSGKEKNFTFVLMGIGVIALLYGLFSHDVSGARFWGNVLLEGLFFTFIALGATFFMALQYVAQAGWSVAVKRVYEAVGTYMPVGLLVIFIVVIASVVGGMSGHHDIVYRWMQKGSVQILQALFLMMRCLPKRKGWLNIPFVMVRNYTIIAGIWIYLAMVMRKRLY